MAAAERRPSLGAGGRHAAGDGAGDTAAWRDPERGQPPDRKSPGRAASGLPYSDRARRAHVPGLAITCAPWTDDDNVLAAPLVPVEILSPSNPKDTWANVGAHVTIPNVQEILVLHTAEIRADVLRRQANGSWPTGSVRLGADAFYGTSGRTH